MTVTLKNIKKTYGDKIVFDGFSREIDLDRPTVIMGESGAGKTTLVRMIAGLERPDFGEISGVPEAVSFMFQEDRLLPWLTARENVAYVSDALTADRYLDSVFLGDEKDTPVLRLSGGMKRRVALARALAYNSGLVILDEPFKGLDADLKRKIISLILKESEKRCFLAVTHEKEDAILLNANIINIG